VVTPVQKRCCGAAVPESQVPSLDLEFTILTYGPKVPLILNGGEPGSLTWIHSRQHTHCWNA